MITKIVLHVSLTSMTHSCFTANKYRDRSGGKQLDRISTHFVTDMTFTLW